MKAPTIKKVRDSEEQGKAITLERNEKRKLENQNKIDEINRTNAMRIIEQLSEMFQNKKVSSRKGCSICGIPPEICSDGTLEIINEYLDGEWFAKFEANTGNADDFEMTNTLLVKPRV